MHRMLRTTMLTVFGVLIISIIGGCGDDSPEVVTNPPQPEDDVQFSPMIKVLIDPPSEGPPILPHTEFALTFNEKAVAVIVNNTPATGSGYNWTWSAFPSLPYGSVKLKIEWKNQDGSKDSKTVGPYEVVHGGGEPPVITGGTVIDGETDVDPALLNAAGITITFDEDIAGSIKLTDEAGVDLNWIGNVAGMTATLTPIAGQELVNETTYKVEIDVHDGGRNPLRETIIFVTKPK